MSRGALFSGWSGRGAVRLHDAVRALAVAEARIAVQRLALEDWAGAHESATRAEGEAACIGWDAMQAAAERLQARAVEGERRQAEDDDERIARAEWSSLMAWGLW